MPEEDHGRLKLNRVPDSGNVVYVCAVLCALSEFACIHQTRAAAAIVGKDKTRLTHVNLAFRMRPNGIRSTFAVLKGDCSTAKSLSRSFSVVLESQTFDLADPARPVCNEVNYTIMLCTKEE